MQNLMNLHKKLDGITQQLGGLDAKTMTEQRRVNTQLRLMAQSVNILAQITEASRAEGRQVLREIAAMANEARTAR
jgi:hypothetical protein